MDDEKKYPIQNIIIKWISVTVSLVACIFSVITVFTAKDAVENIQQQYQKQTQSLENEILNIQEQYQIIQNIIKQEQTVDVIQARDNDVLIRTPDDKWIIVPMIEKKDIEFSSQFIEKQYKPGECNLEKVDLFNNKGENWDKKDSFTYMLPYISINQNKMVSLYQFINKMTIEFKLYNNDKIEYYSEFYSFYIQESVYDYLNVFENISTQKQYVTNEFIGNNGIENIKVSIIIEFQIGGNTFSIPYTFDDYISVNQDF